MDRIPRVLHVQYKLYTVSNTCVLDYIHFLEQLYAWYSLAPWLLLVLVLWNPVLHKRANCNFGCEYYYNLQDGGVKGTFQLIVSCCLFVCCKVESISWSVMLLLMIIVQESWKGVVICRYVQASAVILSFDYPVIRTHDQTSVAKGVRINEVTLYCAGGKSPQASPCLSSLE